MKIQKSNTQYPIAIAIAIVKKPNSIAIAIGYWVLVLHVYAEYVHYLGVRATVGLLFSPRLGEPTSARG